MEWGARWHDWRVVHWRKDDHPLQSVIIPRSVKNGDPRDGGRRICLSHATNFLVAIILLGNSFAKA